MRYISSTKHTAADRLSRRPYCEDDLEDDLDIDEFIAIELNTVRIQPVTIKTVKPYDTKYSARPDWLNRPRLTRSHRIEPDSGSEPYFSGHLERVYFENAHAPSGLRI